MEEEEIIDIDDNLKYPVIRWEWNGQMTNIIECPFGCGKIYHENQYHTLYRHCRRTHNKLCTILSPERLFEIEAKKQFYRERDDNDRRKRRQLMSHASAIDVLLGTPFLSL